ncbi:mechanosensitive ion channel domain-containing protein [Streptomyces sp. NPDC097619]|uniref:mechanosensitive ion channel family protein n=1 Tax=Streptomyces sp. NPDC097619 TaxID=3157228 RepID=UPI00331BF18E
MNSLLRLLIVFGGATLLTLALGRLTELLLNRASSRHPETPLWGLLHRCRPSLQVLFLAILLRATYRQLTWPEFRDHATAVSVVGRGLTLLVIGASAWCVIRVSRAVVESSYARYANGGRGGRRDPSRLRRLRTQVTLIMRIVTAVVIVIAAAAMLLTFPALRTVGTSLLASAGIIGIVAGVAAQSTLGNLFAGFQIAFGDLVRIGDTVVVDGEWGTVEEVTLTFLTVRTWDERRITMPVSYFTGRPFENWSRGGIQMTGTVFLHCHHTVPVEAMRARLKQILDDCPAWDRRAWDLAVTDTTPSTVVVRAIVTAKDPDDLWTLRCAVRERLVTWLAEQHPDALPRITAAVVPSASAGEED